MFKVQECTLKAHSSSTGGYLKTGGQNIKVSTVQSLTPPPKGLHAGALVEMILDHLKILFVFEIWHISLDVVISVGFFSSDKLYILFNQK